MPRAPGLNETDMDRAGPRLPAAPLPAAGRRALARSPVSQITPTLGFGPDGQAELETETGDLQAAASDTPVDCSRIRRALSGVLKVLGRAGASAAKNVAVTMGDDLVREIGQDIIHQLPH
jgi:hypothetical protein